MWIPENLREIESKRNSVAAVLESLIKHQQLAERSCLFHCVLLQGYDCSFEFALFFCMSIFYLQNLVAQWFRFICDFSKYQMKVHSTNVLSVGGSVSVCGHS